VFMKWSGSLWMMGFSGTSVNLQSSTHSVSTLHVQQHAQCADFTCKQNLESSVCKQNIEARTMFCTDHLHPVANDFSIFNAVPSHTTAAGYGPHRKHDMLSAVEYLLKTSCAGTQVDSTRLHITLSTNKPEVTCGGVGAVPGT